MTGYDNLNGYGGSKTDYLNAIATTPDGEMVFVTGTSRDDDTSSLDIATLAFDADGNIVWLTRYSSAASSSAASEGQMGQSSSLLSSALLLTPPREQHFFWGDQAMALAVSPDGKTVYITGYTRATSYNVGDLVTIAYDASTGEDLWVRTYDGPGGGLDIGFDIAVSPDGSRVFVTGHSAEPSDSPYETRFNMVSSDFVTIGYDAANKEEPWVSRYDGFEAPDGAYSIGVSPDGSRIFVTGPSTSEGVDTSNAATDYTTVSYDSDSGDRIWVRRTDRGPHDYAYDLKVSPDGSKVFVTGESTEEYLTEAYRSSDGKLLWSVPYHGVHNGFAHANAIAVDPTGSRVYVTGAIPTPGSNSAFVNLQGTDYGTVAYDANTGQQQWEARYSWGLTTTLGLAVEATADRVVVTGKSQIPIVFNSDATTVSYDPSTGRQLWAARYNGSENGLDRDVGNSLAVSPDGSEVYVGGSFLTSGANSNFGLLAYQL